MRGALSSSSPRSFPKGEHGLFDFCRGVGGSPLRHSVLLANPVHPSSRGLGLDTSLTPATSGTKYQIWGKDFGVRGIAVGSCTGTSSGTGLIAVAATAFGRDLLHRLGPGRSGPSSVLRPPFSVLVLSSSNTLEYTGISLTHLSCKPKVWCALFFPRVAHTL